MLIKKYTPDLLELIRYAQKDRNLELEVIIKDSQTNEITSDLFFNAMKRLKGESDIRLEEESTVLDIGLTGDYREVRVSVYGDSNITEYCQKNDIKQINPGVVSYMKKTPIRFVNVKEYGLKFNLKREQIVDKNDRDVSDIIKSWSGLGKTFRYKKRFSFVSRDNNYRFDLTMIKNSNKKTVKTENTTMKKRNIKPFMKKYVVKPSYVVDLDSWFEKLPMNADVEMVGKSREEMIPTKSIQKSNVLTNDIDYEIEIEYMGNKGSFAMNDKTILRNLLNYTIMILQSIQKSYFIISTRERSMVIDNYKKIMGDYRFNGPQNVTLTLQHMREKNYDEYKNTVNIRKGYSVTDKADGERNLLIILEDGGMYLMNRKNYVRKLDASCPELRNSILDTEYIQIDKMGKNINMLMLFDIYFKNNEDLRERILYRTNSEIKKDIIDISRLEILNETMEAFNNIQKSSRNNLQIRKKKFFFGDDDVFSEEINNNIMKYRQKMAKQSSDSEKYRELHRLVTELKGDTKIFREADSIYNKEYPYHIDGLIFTPRKLMVGEEPDKEKRNMFNGRWYRSFKWKPPEENTIDFMVSFKKDENGKDLLKQYITVRDKVIECRVLVLKVGYNPTIHTKHNSCRVLNENVFFEERYEPVPFYPTQPYIKNIHLCYLPIENGNCYTEDRAIISDNTIVEFKYKGEDDFGFWWKPMRTRDTLKPNDFITANNVWNSIFNPVTLDMIRTGNIDEKTLSLLSLQSVYYDNKTKRKDKSSKPMNDFHSYIKKKIIKENISGKKTLLDLGVGKAGDINHWGDAGCKAVIGIDIVKDNLDNIEDGACNRLLNKYQSANEVPFLDNTIMIWGDCSRSLMNTDAGLDDLQKYYLNIVYGNIDKDAIPMGKLRNFHNMGRNVDLIVSNFALHYFFEKKSTMIQLIKNVSTSLVDGGKFVCTCLNGTKIFDILKKKTIYHSESYDWKITKKYDSKVFPATEESLGKKIEVYIESIGQSIDEYLVNIDYFTEIAEEFGLVLRENKSFEEIFSQVKVDKIQYGQMQSMSDEQREYSILNNYYIFEKVKST